MGFYQRRRQRQEKCHLKVSSCAIVTIFQLSHLVRILQRWQRALQLDWSVRREIKCQAVIEYGN